MATLATLEFKGTRTGRANGSIGHQLMSIGGRCVAEAMGDGSSHCDDSGVLANIPGGGRRGVAQRGGFRMLGRLRRFRLSLVACAVIALAGSVLFTVPFATVASAGTGWSGPAAVDDSSPVVIDSVSCTSTTFCAGVNSAQNEATLYNGSHWSAQTTYEGTGPSTSAVSCVSSTFCVATDSSGNAIFYNGHTWSVTAAGFDMSSISCVSSSFCMGVTEGASSGDAVLYNGTTWTPTVIDSGVDLWSVSCPTTSFCETVDNNGNAFRYNGASWTSQGNVDSNPGLGIPWIELSCTLSGGTLCAMTDGYGFGFHFNGATWTADGDLNVSHYFLSVSCASASFCAAVDSGGSMWSYTGTGWSGLPPEPGHPYFNSVSCPQGSSFCLAVDNEGNYFVTPDAETEVLPEGVATDSAPTEILAVSCATSAFCVTADPLGNAVTYSGDKWASPESADDNALNSVSCPTATFCAAVDDAGEVVMFDGSSWSAPDNIAGINMLSVSCSSADSCVAIDNAGDALLYNGSTWTDNAEVDGSQLLGVSCAPGTAFCAAIDAAGGIITTTDGGMGSWATYSTGDANLTSVSCATASFCVVVDGEGNALVTDNGGSTWSGPVDIDGSQLLTSVSCATANFCVAVDGAGNALLTSDGASSWSSPTDIDTTQSLRSVSCASPTFCVAVDAAGNALLYTPSSPAGLYVSEVAPYTGLTTGSTAVTISGSGFTTYSVTNVYFGTGMASNVHVLNNTTITVDSPPESAGTVDVTVATTAGTSSVNSADQFTYTVATSPTMESCNPSCSVAVATPLAATTVLASAASSEVGAELDLSVNAGTLPCPGAYNYQAAVSTLSSTNFVADATATVTETVGDLPSTKGVKVCYAPLIAPTGTFLSKCHTHVVAPCIQSLKELYGHAGVVATLVVSATDPRFWTGNGSIDATGFSPSHGAPGSTITIKGTNLSGVVGVSIGGSSAHIAKTSAKKLSVTVPSSAQTGLVTVTAASGSVTSPTVFTVTGG
jgi:IPT/TIG domain